MRRTHKHESTAMATTLQTKSHKAKEKKSAPKSAAAEAPHKDAIALLKADHREVEGWFDEYEDATSKSEKAALAGKICTALTVHAQIEEEIFYPAAREATEDNDLLDEATVEHASAKELIAQIMDMKPGDDLFDAKVTVLGEQIKHHVKEEEGELFPEAKKSKMDMEDIGAKLAARKAELMKRAGQ
jgi:hemerythrin superfamily protein